MVSLGFGKGGFCKTTETHLDPSLMLACMHTSIWGHPAGSDSFISKMKHTDEVCFVGYTNLQSYVLHLQTYVYYATMFTITFTECCVRRLPGEMDGASRYTLNISTYLQSAFLGVLTL